MEALVREGAGDCVTIAVVADRHGATVELRTRDGRTARRKIDHPEELVPVVQALLVVLQPEPEPEPEPPADAPPPTSAPDNVPSAGTRNKPEIFVALGVGLKAPSEDTVTPRGEALVGTTFGRFDLGAFGRWEMEHDELESHTRQTSLSSVGGGAMLGRRDPLGPIWIIAGGTFGAYDVEQEEHHRGVKHEHVEAAHVDARAGAYLGAVMRVDRARIRLALDGEVGLLARAPKSAVFPDVPGWSAGVTLGFETGIMP